MQLYDPGVNLAEEDEVPNNKLVSYTSPKLD